MKAMFSKYPGTCVTCNHPIEKGEYIRYWGRGRGISHYTCPSARLENITGKCWDCGAEGGRMRNYGASTPCLCDSCEAKRRERDKHRFDHTAEDYPCTDRGYEDQCARACGFDPEAPCRDW